MDNLDGYFTDDGMPINPNLIPRSSLCVMCEYNDDAKQEKFCELTRLDQQGEKSFRCDVYKQKN